MTAFPSGTVTLLFTDIQGSTHLLQNLGPLYSDVLRTHQTLLREAFHAHNGVEVNTEGDAFFVAFDRAIDGLKAAAQSQRALANYPWPEGISLRVRMGLHTGTPLLTEDDYVGLDVHRAARIASAAHGGQVLLSLATRELCADGLPADCLLLNLGTHMLKDLQRPEHIYQLVLPDLPSTFPPIKSLNNRSHNLPIQQTLLLGREKELGELSLLLKEPDARLLTIIGPGGIGKTRLSIQVAAEMIDVFSDGVYFISLASLHDPQLVLPTIVRTLGLHETGNNARDHLLRFLDEKELLLILDNFEQVVESAGIIAAILEHCPGVKVLVTTRIALHLRGEREYPVHPFPLPSAADQAILNLQELSHYAAILLFIERARSVKPTFQVTLENAASIAAICTQLDGLPLAIELAASRIKYLSPQALLSHLSRSLKLLTGGSRDLPTRQQTLYNLIGWSYDLLSQDEKTLFQRLSIFADGCTLETAESICGSPDLQPLDLDILDGIGSLVDKSLVIYQNAGINRFLMLQTIREFGLAQLTRSPEYASLRQSSTQYYLAFAEPGEAHPDSMAQQQRLDLLETELNNIFSVLSWSLEDRNPSPGLRLANSLWHFWVMRGYVHAGLSHLEALLSLPASLTPDENIRAGALYAAGSLALRKGQYKRAEQWLAESLALSRSLDNTSLTAQILNSLAITESYQQNLDRAATYFEESLALHQKAAFQHGIATALINLGEIAYYRDSLEQAEKLTRQAQQMLQAEEEKDLIAITLVNLANIARRQGAFAHALELARQALTLQQRLHDLRGIAEALECLGKILVVQSNPVAPRILGAAARLRERVEIPLSLSERTDLERVLPQDRNQAASWLTAYASGQAASLEEILQDAFSG